MYKFVATLLFTLTKLLRKLKTVDKHNIPVDEPYIVTCNHESMVEIIMLAMSLYPAEIHYMAKQELFKYKLLDRFFKSVNAFPVNRQNPGPSTLKIPVKLLKEGNIVGIFPSGHRHSDAPMKKGAATIAVLSKQKIVPAAYTGPLKFRDVIFGKQKCIIKFGQPINTNTFLEQYNKNDAIEQITLKLESETKALIQSMRSS